MNEATSPSRRLRVTTCSMILASILFAMPVAAQDGPAPLTPTSPEAYAAWKLSLIGVGSSSPGVQGEPPAAPVGAGLLIPFESGGWTPFPSNDDGSTSELALGFNFAFYGTVWPGVFLNNNGNITFGEPFMSFSPSGFPSTAFAMLAPFWSDVDTRCGECGLAYYKIESAGDGSWRRFVAHWEDVAHFNLGQERGNTFQVVISNGNDPLLGSGNNVCFSYGDMQWTTGDADGGVNGFGGVPATVGANRGDGLTFFQYGRFDHEGTDYDGPGGQPDGVSFLDGQSFCFATSQGLNVPPVATGLPEDNTYFVYVGETLDTNVAFLSGELNQTTTVSVDADGLANFTSLTVPGNPATVQFIFTPGADQLGDNFVAVTATDNGGPPQSTRVTLNFRVESRCGNGEVDPGEDCDDGNDAIGDGCRPDCTRELCGDGILDPGEDCDDGNTADGDCCSATCTFEASGSTCDDGLFCTANDTCDGAGVCLAGGDLDCGDGDICTDDFCDEVNDTCVNELDTTNDPSCEPSECGNGIVEGLEECDDGNTADGDCCAADCTFEPAASTCDDGSFCTANDTCDGAGACLAGGDLDCSDGDICTDDSCDEVNDTCVNDFDVDNDPTCERERVELIGSASCGFGLGSAEVCFDLTKATDDGLPGGADDVTAIDWCIGWDSTVVDFDCSDEDQDGVPDDLALFVGPSFTTIVQCTPTDPVCSLRVSILDQVLPFDVLPDATLACATFSVLPGVSGGDSPAPLSAASASDTLGISIPVETTSAAFAVDGCCLADCNSDDRVDIADAVSVILELSDTDGNDFCDTDEVIPFDGNPCCDCNADRRIDIADAVCVINGLGELSCPATAAASATTLAETWQPPQTEMLGSDAKQSVQPESLMKAGLTLVQQQMGWSVVVPLIFQQDSDDQQPGGRDEITAFSTCIDFDQTVLRLDMTDADLDGIPDALDIRLPVGHAAFVKVDLSRSECELHLGVLDLSPPSAALPDGVVAEIRFEMLGRAAGRGIWVRPGPTDAVSFADVLGISQPVGVRVIGSQPKVE